MVEFPREVADLPVRRPDPDLRRFLERHAAALMSRLPAEGGVVDRVRAQVAEALAREEPAQARVARRLAISERTLQRRLQEEGTTFGEIVESVRRELAERYLSEPEVSVHSVAFLLGYSEPSAFHRAFRRWTGTTPRAFREKARRRAAHDS